MINDFKEDLPDDLIFSIQKIYVPAGFQVTIKALRETESSGYGACRFALNGRNIVFRVAKTTPNKAGQFVTLWKRPSLRGVIIPIDITDNIDFVVVSVTNVIYRGQFIFDQKILLDKHIMSQDTKEGKRAFRLYPPWIRPISKEAVKTQNWQLPYFVSLDQESSKIFEEVRKLFKPQF
jgi:hypothetical protein